MPATTFASRCLRMTSPSIHSCRFGHASKAAVYSPLQCNLSFVFNAARSLLSRPRLWNSARTSPFGVKINAFLSDFPSKPPQNSVPFLFKQAVNWLSTATGNAGALPEFTVANPTSPALFASSATVLVGYGIARTGASASNELRTAIFSKVALRTIRQVSRKGLHQVQKAVDVTSNYFKLPTFASPSYVVRSSIFYTTVCQCLHEQREFTSDADKVKDSADIFREWGCSENDISKLFKRRPSLRKADIQILQSKLEILSNLGIKSTDLVKMVHCRPRFLNCKIDICLNERLKYLEDLFGSKEVLVKAFVRNPSLLIYDFHNKIKPVIAVYEALGLCKKDLIAVLLARPTLIPRTNLDNEKIDYIRRTGVSKESKMYKHVVSLFAISRKETIREKVMNLEKYGLSEDEILSLVGRSPLVLTLSTDKIQRNMTFILGTLRLPASTVLSYPFLLYFNLEAVLKPRFQIACKIEDMGLVPRMKGPSTVLRAMRMSDKRFISAYISHHPKDVAKELITTYENAKCVRRLAESSKKHCHKGFPV